MKDNLVVYSAMFGDYDNIQDPLIKEEGIDYILFTDNKDIKSDIWDIKLITEKENNPITQARFYKHNPHVVLNEYKYSLWVDANFLILGNIVNLYDKIKDNKFVVLQHCGSPKNDIISELIRIIQLRKADFGKVGKQVQKYLDNGLKVEQNLVETGIMFRHHMDIDVVDFQKQWYNEITSNSKRDQLSFPWVIYKTGLKYGLFPSITSASLRKYLLIRGHK